ncbi:hypothetical protein CO046_00950 [Candidatus Peregrinibacteria bacterium CG_4_9_14_0_2_um_filter_53_11]|nr:MAG: hypothetical protein CO046_00950 [Candidatus Peregrinibacteria bacterium CG_4_9_14_0_2_um_filter_53_11]
MSHELSIQSPKGYQLLLSYAFSLLARKGYSEFEFRRKFKVKAARLKLEEPDEAIDRVIDKLKELGYLNDEELARNYLTYTVPGKPQGRGRFMAAMYRRGIDRDLAVRLWDAEEVDEEELARKVLNSYLPRWSRLESNSRKRKAQGLLLRRGFNPGIVWRLIATLDSSVDS